MHISLAAEELFTIFGVHVTNALFTSWIVVVILIVVAFLIKRGMATIPTGIQNVTEAFFEGMLSIADSVTGSRKQSEQFFPIVATLFFFILFGNYFGLLPGIGTIGLEVVEHGEHVFVPIFRPINADLNTTLALAIVAVLATQVVGIMAVGGWKYAKKFFNPSKNPVNTFVGILELISEFAKFISFSFRLFGNVFAGEVLLVVVAFLVPYIAPLPFFFLELFVGFIQAFVFALLTLVFFKVATLAEAH
ncbi:MAG: F0F1 ATP synthase subunit A [Patescibacteria group bacterium]